MDLYIFLFCIFVIVVLITILVIYAYSMAKKCTEYQEKLETIKKDAVWQQISLMWDTCSFAMTDYSKKLEQFDQKMYIECLELRNRCTNAIRQKTATVNKSRGFEKAWDNMHIQCQEKLRIAIQLRRKTIEPRDIELTLKEQKVLSERVKLYLRKIARLLEIL